MGAAWSYPMKSSKVLDGLMGLCVGDALGVPVEFSSREELIQTPVTDMHSPNRWNQLPETWSDDSSLTFCLADALCSVFSLQAIADSFCDRHKYRSSFPLRSRSVSFGYRGRLGRGQPTWITCNL